ncbi:hypothetical protein [Psychromonas hadalis]|uniref:hypothetical protein n=1 Tax=Psychromonas hadalis TaxID=211669 RepID=UPI0003B4E7B9|nr:hypothetical protein [Psychromonas hadalis]
MDILGLSLALVGLLIGIANWPISIRKIVNKKGPSGVPLVGGIFMLIGVLIMPSGKLTNYLWLAPIIDFTYLPLWIYGIFIKKAN